MKSLSISLLLALLLLHLAPAEVAAQQRSAQVIAPLGDLLIFQSPTGGLWRTDGTQSGTFPLAAIPRSPYNFRPLMGQAGERMLFMVEVAQPSAPNGERVQVWATDGTVDGTQQITFHPGGLPLWDSPWLMYDYQAAPTLGFMFFRMTFPETGERQLWVSDGTPAGTHRVTDLAGRLEGVGRLLGAGKDRFLFQGTSSAHGAELWITDGTAAGTRLLRDFVPGPESSEPHALTSLGDQVFFTFSNPFRQHELWVTDGSAGGTRLLATLSEHQPELGWNTGWWQGVAGESQVFLLAEDPLFESYSNIVRSDGTPDGTYSLHGSDRDFAALGDSVLFFAWEADHGREPWISDGTREGTRLLRDLYPGPTEAFVRSEIIEVGSLAYFVTSTDWYMDPVGWVTDGTTAGTVPFFSLSQVNWPFYEPSLIAGPGNHLFFKVVRARCTDGAPCVDEPELWATPAAGGGLGSATRVLEPSSVLSLHGVPGWELVGAPLKNDFLFLGSDLVNGTALWRSDATPEGTYPQIVLEPPDLPGPIVRLTATPTGPGTGEIALDWSPAARAVTYNLAVSSPLQPGFAAWRTWLWDTSMITALPSDLPHAFRVQAVNDFGAGPWSEVAAATPLPAVITPCVPGEDSLCLHGSRFEVKAFYRDHIHDGWGAAQAAPMGSSDDSGAFWFFDHDNLELMVKVLDARVVNGYFWSFFGGLTTLETWITVTDTEEQTNVTFHKNANEMCGRADVAAFPRPAFESLATGGTCEPGPDHLCLTGNRYRVEVTWRDQRSGHTGVGHALPGTEDSGFFWFFDDENVELLVKVLDATTVNGHIWVFSGSMTDVEYTLTVTDTLTGEHKQYFHPPGSLCGQADVAAF